MTTGGAVEKLESTKALKIMVFGKSEVVTDRNRALGSKGAEALRRTSSIARSISLQPEVHVGSKRLLPIFSHPQQVCHRMA